MVEGISEEMVYLMEGEEMSNPLKPTCSVLCKLGSIAVHVQEMLSAKGHHFDKLALESLMQDKELTDWLHDMDKLAMIPKAR